MHLATPMQRRVAVVKLPPSWAKASSVRGPMVGVPTKTLRSSSSLRGSTTRPGFIRPSGSQIALNAPNASIVAGV